MIKSVVFVCDYMNQLFDEVYHKQIHSVKYYLQ